MAVTVTVGTNSYISVANAQLYLDERLFCTEWTAASADDKARALIMATKKIDRLPLKGVKPDDVQALEFPRSRYSDDLGYWIVETEVAQCVKDAVCEEALALLGGVSDRMQMQAQGVKSFSIGNLSETYVTGNNAAVKLLSQEARELLRPYLAGSVVI